MARYKYVDPSGVTHFFEGPKGLVQQDIDLFAQRFLAPPAEPEPAPPLPKGEPGFFPSIMRGGRGIASLVGDVLPAMGAKALGFKDYAEQQMQEAAKYQEETQRLYPAEVASFTDIKDIGSALTYVKEAIGEAIPSILPSIFTGGAAGIASKGAQVAAEKAAQKAAVEFATKELVRKGGQAALTQEALAPVTAAALEAGKKAAQRVALKYEVAGTLAGSAAQNVPESYQNLYEKGSGELPDLAPALVSGGFNAVLDAVTPLNILRKAKSAGIPENAIIGAWYKRAGKGAVEGFVSEGATEAIQEMSNAAAESFVDKNAEFFSPQNFVRFIDAGLKGGFGGAGITSATNVLYGRKETPPKAVVPEGEETTTPPPPPMDPESKAFKKKQERYENLVAGIAELEAKGDQLTTPELGQLKSKQTRAGKLKTEIDGALAQYAAWEAENATGTQPGTARERFEILEQPGEGTLPDGTESTPSAGVGGAGAVSGVPPSGEGEQPSPLNQAPVTPTGTPPVTTPEVTPTTPSTAPAIDPAAAAARMEEINQEISASFEAPNSSYELRAPLYTEQNSLYDLFDTTRELKQQLEDIVGQKIKFSDGSKEREALEKKQVEVSNRLDEAWKKATSEQKPAEPSVNKTPEQQNTDFLDFILGGDEGAPAAQTTPTAPTAPALPQEVQNAVNLLSDIGSGKPVPSAQILNVAKGLGIGAGKETQIDDVVSRIRDAVSQTGQGEAPSGVAGAKKAQEQQNDDFLDFILGNDEDTLKAARRTKEEIALDEKLDALGKEYGLKRDKGEGTRDFALRVRKEREFSKRLESTPVSEMSNAEIAGQDIREGKSYSPPDEQRQLYEETREEFNAGIDEEAKRAYDSAYEDAIEEGLSEKQATRLAEEASGGFEDDKLPQYRELTDDARRVYFQNHISRNDQTEHDKAAQALSGYLSSKRQESRAGVQDKETEARESYSREREAFSKPSSLRYNFPQWNSLSDESKKLYIAVTSAQNNNSALQQQIAFNAVKGQIRKELAEKQKQERESGVQDERRRLEEIETERQKAGQPAGKGEPLSKAVRDALARGDIGAALEHLQFHAEGVKPISGERRFGQRVKNKLRDAIARGVFRNLAGVIRNIPDFNVNIVIDENMPDGTYGEYSASTNTVYLSPQGMDEATLLHELTHAATVKIIHQYYTDKSKLTPRAVEAVEHLQKIAAMARPGLSSDIRFQNAFDNLYEFVAYAMTDTDFQFALSQIQVGTVRKYTEKTGEEFTEAEQEERESGMMVPPMEEKSLWSYFVRTLAWLYRLLTPRAKLERVLIITEETRTTTSKDKIAADKRQIAADTKRRVESEEQDRINAADKKLRDAKKKLRENKDDEVTEFLEREAKEAEQVLEFEKRRRKTPKKTLAEEDTEALPSDIDELFDDAAAEGVSEEDADEAKIEPVYTTYGTQFGLTKLLRGIMREPGYRGNALVEAASAFEQILAAPEGGINRLAGKTFSSGYGRGLAGRTPEEEQDEERLYAKAPPQTKTAPSLKTDSSTMSDEDFKAAVLGQLKLKEGGSRDILKTLLSQRGYDWFVQKFQNERQAIKKIFDRAQKFGIIKRVGENINDVWGQITRSTGMAVDLFATHMKPLVDEVHEGIEAYAKKKGISVTQALNNLHLIFEARHEPERRLVKFLLKVPLDDVKKFSVKGFTDNKGGPLALSAAGWREHILEQLSRSDLAPNEVTRKYKAQQYRALMEQIAFDKNMHEKVAVKTTNSKGKTITEPVVPAMFDPNSERYSVIAGRTPAEIKRITKMFDLKEDAAEINRIADALKKVQQETKDLNRVSNYWSIPVENVVNFYGYENYVPFKGKPGDDNEVLSLDSRRIGGELQDGENRFEGRLSEADNPLLQSLAEGAQAAMRAGRRELTLAIKNAIKDKIIDGKIIKDKIKFADRYVRGETKEELGGASRIFHYNADGSIEVLEIKNKQQLEAIRRSFRTSSPIIDIINSLTSGIGQTHTRYNPAFAPMNFVRDSFTNAFTLGAELGPARAGRLIKAISAEVASGGLYRSMNFSKLYAEGKFSDINRLAGGTAAYESLTEEQRYYRDLLDYVKSGGKVSYLQGVAAKGALDSLMKEVGRSGVLKTKDQIDKFFDIYNETFELAARVGAFRVLRDEFRAAGESNEEAHVHAVEYAKNLANFEQVGQWGKAAGAAFMFFRPAATGAVRAIDALRPAFGFNEKDFRAAAAQEGRTPEQIDRAVEVMKQEQKSARAMAGGLAGMGVAMYMIAMMLSGDDDQKRNRVATDDVARWTRYARFFIPGFEKPLQIPWGFGMGAFAAAGAQIASLASGRVSLADVASNIATIGLDSFMPLPFSRISPVENFPAFVLDSVTPSAARPFFEYMMNLDGLGREIYNNRQSRYGDAYTGGDSIPEIYKSAARTIFKATNGSVDWSPNTMYFFANNYMDGAMKAFSSAYNLGLTLMGKKDFDLKNDTPFASSFIGTKSNIDAREFSKAEKYIADLSKQVNALKDKPDMYRKFVAENPDKVALVQMYNQQVNGTLRNLRAYANQLRVADMEPRERKPKLDQAINMQNVVKRQILDGFENYAHYRP